MSKSYQQEIPLARVNITLDVETGGNQSKKELPMKLLMLGDYSHGQAMGSIATRERMSINKHNFNQVLGSLAPKVTFSVANRLKPNAPDLNVKLEFKAISDFKPEKVIEQVPALKRLMAMRTLLKDLKSSIIDNHTFRKELEKILKDNSNTTQLKQALMKQAPLIDDDVAMQDN